MKREKHQRAEEDPQPDSTTSVGQMLGHYRVMGELGRGGMGEVYRVADTKLDREVALKVVPPELAADPRRLARFAREAKTLAALNHPNIVQIYSVETATLQRTTAAKRAEQTVHFLTMELVEGKTLDHFIPAEGLGAEKFFELAVPIAEAVGAAHERGVTHRDLKPGNVMVTAEGRVKVLDFGLAKPAPMALGDETELATEPMTAAGLILGTVPYMSPEQAEGKPVDLRSDVFSLGIMLYEMVTGKRPFEGDSSLRILSAIVQDDPPSVTEVKPELPRHLARIIGRCLEKERKRRFQSGVGLYHELESFCEETKFAVRSGVLPAQSPTRWSVPSRFLAAIAIVAALAAVTTWVLVSRPQPAPATDQVVKIVVLPFENLGALADEYFADGMTEEINSRLSALEGLAVISRRSAMKYKGTQLSLKELSDEFGVDYVLEGSVRWQKSDEGLSRVRVTPQLIQVADDRQLWSERYDAVPADIFDVQSDIAERVSDALGVALVVNPVRPTDNIEAYDAYLQANDYLHRGMELDLSEQLLFAIEMYDRALELDPTFAQALARQSAAHSWLYKLYFDRNAARAEKAREAAMRAADLNPDLPEVHHALGLIFQLVEVDRQRAVEEFQLALKAQPNNSLILESLAWVQMELGLWDEGIESMAQAIEIDPFGRFYCWTGGCKFAQRRYDEAMRFHDDAIRLSPQRSCPYFCQVIIALNDEGDTERAREILGRLPPSLGLEGVPPLNYPWLLVEMVDQRYDRALERLAAGPSEVYTFNTYWIPKDLLYAQIYGLLGRSELETAHYEAARARLEDEVSERPEDPRLHSSLGIAYAGLGMADRAISEGRLGLELLSGSLGLTMGYRLKDLVQIYTMVGDHGRALESLEKLLSVPNTAPYVSTDPTWAPLWDDPLFVELQEKYG